MVLAPAWCQLPLPRPAEQSVKPFPAYREPAQFPVDFATDDAVKVGVHLVDEGLGNRPRRTVLQNPPVRNKVQGTFMAGNTMVSRIVQGCPKCYAYFMLDTPRP